jgi:hypothetical protein
MTLYQPQREVLRGGKNRLVAAAWATGSGGGLKVAEKKKKNYFCLPVA